MISNTFSNKLHEKCQKVVNYCSHGTSSKWDWESEKSVFLVLPAILIFFFKIKNWIHFTITLIESACYFFINKLFVNFSILFEQLRWGLTLVFKVKFQMLLVLFVIGNEKHFVNIITVCCYWVSFLSRCCLNESCYKQN